MKLNDKWEILAGPRKHDLILREWYKGKKKDGTEVDKYRDSYHPTLAQCVNKIIRQECIDYVDLSDDIAGLVEHMKTLEQSILNHVEDRE